MLSEHPPEQRRRRGTILLGLTSILTLAGAISTAVLAYDPNAPACPDGAPQPGGFWLLLVTSLATAIGAFVARPRQRNEQGLRTGAQIFAILLVVLMPIAFAVTAIAEGVAYACWE
jgi:hypothetical protein